MARRSADMVRRHIARQAAEVESLRRRLAFELLLLRRMRREASAGGASVPALTLQDVRLRALERQAEAVIATARTTSGG